MIRNVLQSISDIDIYPLISLGMFFSIFLYVVIKVITAKKSHIDKMANMPLEN